jgi:hypothetical protein
LKPKGKRYSDEFKYNVMAAWASGKYKKELDIANEFKIPLKTLREWREKEQPQNWYEYQESLTAKKEKLSQDKLLNEWEKSIKTYCNIGNKTEEVLKTYLDEIINENNEDIKEIKLHKLSEIINLTIRSQHLKANALGIGIGKHGSKNSEGSISLEEHNRIITNFVEVMLNVLANNISEQNTLNKIIAQVSTYKNSLEAENKLRRVK